MSHLAAPQTSARFPVLRKLSLLLLTLLLTAIALGLFFRVLSHASAGAAPMPAAHPEQPLVAPAQPTFPAAAVPSFNEQHFFGAGGAAGVVVGDMNGDGILDIIQGSVCDSYSCLPNMVYINAGAGDLFYTRTLGTGNTDTWSVATGDLNGDGALDIVTGNQGQDVLYLNDGAGNFTPHNFGPGDDWTTFVAVADMNGDGALDIIAGNAFVTSTIYLNDGAGNFPNTSPYTRPFGMASDAVSSVAIVDLNGDGALDIAVGNYVGPNTIYLNDGAGNFPNASPYTRTFGTGSDWTTQVAVGDLNGDGVPDLVVGNAPDGQGQGGQNVVYLNDGTGNFPNTFPYTRPFGTGNDWTTSVALGDLNKDGALDLAVGNYSSGQNVVYLNDGAGNFADTGSYTRPFGMGNDSTRGVAIGDMNGDGALDIVAGNQYEPNVICLNDGAGDWSGPRRFGTGSDSSLGMALGDMNGDGMLDIIVANYLDQPGVVYLNDGTGNFPNTTPYTRPFGHAHASTTRVAVGDMNGDGLLDIIAGNRNGQPGMVYLNDGTGNFPNTSPYTRSFGTGGDDTHALAVGDLNGDGALDIVVGRWNYWPGPNMIYLNDGAGNFIARPFGMENRNTRSVAVGDLNKDSALDIVVGNYTDRVLVYLNDGIGNLSISKYLGAGGMPLVVLPWET